MIDIWGGSSIKPRWEQWVRLSGAGRIATAFCKPRASEPPWGNRNLTSAQLHWMTHTHDSRLECVLALLCMFVCVFPHQDYFIFRSLPQRTGKASLAKLLSMWNGKWQNFSEKFKPQKNIKYITTSRKRVILILNSFQRRSTEYKIFETFFSSKVNTLMIPTTEHLRFSLEG